ncbi:MAG: flavodoxin domain-containing protein [Bacteroidales bacterium]|nr:flavodoxin domain-containing protein [Bacteroidales bacterium]
MKKTAIFYGPEGGRTESVAKQIAKLLAEEKPDLIPVSKAGKGDIEQYDNLVLGIATIGNETWDAEPVKTGWFEYMPVLEGENLDNKKIAIYGLGDHVRWPLHFVDSMGELYRLIKEKGHDTVGKVNPEDYTFDESEALVDGLFIGLPVDEDFEAELTESRIKNWVNDLKKHFND